MTTLTITKEAPPSMSPTEILFKGNFAWRATLAATSSAAYFFFLQKTEYHPLKTNKHIVQFLAANVLVQYAFQFFAVDQYVSSLFRSTFNTTVAYLQEKDEKVQLNTSQVILAALIGKERFRYFFQTKFLNPETSFTQPYHEKHVRTLCDRIVLREQILADKATLLKTAEEEKSIPLYQKIYHFAGFAFANLGAIYLLQSTTPHLGTFERAAYYLFTNTILQLIIGASVGEGAPMPSPYALFDFSDFANLNLYSRIEKQRIIAHINNQISSFIPDRTRYSEQMNETLELAQNLDRNKKALCNFFVKKLYDDMNAKNGHNIPVYMEQLALCLPSKADALLELIEIKDLDRPGEFLDEFVAILKSKTPAPLHRSWIKRTFTQFAISAPSPEIDPATLEIEDNTDYKTLQREIESSTKALRKKIQTLTGTQDFRRELQKSHIMLPIAYATRACVLLNQQTLSKKDVSELKEILNKIKIENYTLHTDPAAILREVQELLPANRLESVKKIVSSRSTISKEYKKLREEIASLVKYYPKIQKLLDIIPAKKPAKVDDRRILYDKIKARANLLNKLNYACNSVEECERAIAYCTAHIRQKEEHFFIQKTFSYALASLSSLSWIAPRFGFAQNTLPAKAFRWVDKEYYIQIAIETIFNYCVKKL